MIINNNIKIAREIIKLADQLVSEQKKADHEGKYRGFTGTIDWKGSKAEVRDADFDLTGKGIYWKNGTWVDGDWNDGYWERGTWDDGTWKDGIWRTGVWNDGTWEKGNWNSGEWKGGTFENGYWKTGYFSNGTFAGGIWNNGVFAGGEFTGGTWKKGGWVAGKWIGGTWKTGLSLKGFRHNNPPNKWKEVSEIIKMIPQIPFRKRTIIHY